MLGCAQAVHALGNGCVLAVRHSSVASASPLGFVKSPAKAARQMAWADCSALLLGLLSGRLLHGVTGCML